MKLGGDEVIFSCVVGALVAAGFLLAVFGLNCAIAWAVWCAAAWLGYPLPYWPVVGATFAVQLGAFVTAVGLWRRRGGW